MTPRDKAMETIAKLKRVAEHPNTGKPEADAARARIEALQKKHNITPGVNHAKPLKDFTKQANDFAAEARRAKQAADRMADAMRKAQAAEAWRKRMADKDDLGRPKKGDIFDEAIRRSGDNRTTGERNKDMQDRLRHGYCNPKESFYDQGGEPRKRNDHVAMCEKCHGTLRPGEGAVLMVGGNWKVWCCDMTPKPRKKRF